MKVRTKNNEPLRKEFTAFEAAALVHAAEHETEGAEFTGVPSAKEDRYKNSAESFRVLSKGDGVVEIMREKTGAVLAARYYEGAAPREAKEAKEAREVKEENEVITKKENNMESNLSSGVMGIFAEFNKLVSEAVRVEVEKALKDVKPVRQEIVVKVAEQTRTIEGIVHPKFERVLKYVARHKNVYLYGPAGSGKNVMCEQIAEALGVPFYYQNTILTKFDVTGYSDVKGDFVKTEFYKAWTEGGVFMLDEADNATAEAMVTLNAALANGYYSFPSVGMVKKHEKFFCVAAGNTNGQGATEDYCGRYKMDESSRDRFAFVFIDYDKKVEEGLVGDKTDVLEFIYELREVCKDTRISLILGYRAIKNLVEFYDDDPREIIEDWILKGLEVDSVREIADKLTGENKYVKAMKEMAK